MSALLLLDLANPYFEAMYEMTKPRGLLAILRFTTEGWPLYLIVGLIGEQPYAILVTIALAGIVCLISAAWIA